MAKRRDRPLKQGIVWFILVVGFLLIIADSHRGVPLWLGIFLPLLQNIMGTLIGNPIDRGHLLSLPTPKIRIGKWCPVLLTFLAIIAIVCIIILLGRRDPSTPHKPQYICSKIETKNTEIRVGQDLTFSHHESKTEKCSYKS